MESSDGSQVDLPINGVYVLLEYQSSNNPNNPELLVAR